MKTALDDLDKFDNETVSTINRNFYVDDCPQLIQQRACRVSCENYCQEELLVFPNGSVMTGT